MKKNYFSKLIILVALLTGWNTGSIAQTVYSTPGTSTYTVPPGVTSVSINMFGGSGGTSNCSGVGGKGGRVQCTLAVTGGQILQVNVAGAGANYVCCGFNAGGYNGGGQGYSQGGGGGGGSDVRATPYALANRLVVSSGGGGAGYNWCNEKGGDGGGLSGSYGAAYSGSPNSYSGAPGTQVCCAVGATYCCGCTSPGALGQGGNVNCGSGGGGGGGGYYGGGSGDYYTPGGGGSGFTDPVLCSSVTQTPAYNAAGNGQVTICPGPIAGTLTGTGTLCPAGGTTQLTDVGGVGGGAWSSSSANAIVSPAGLVTGVNSGTATISYTVSSACASSSALMTVTVLPKPTAYNLTGGGSYCAGAAGVDVATDGSDVGTTYKMYKSGALIQTKAGTGVPVDYGLITVAGTYTDTATINSTGCSIILGGSPVVGINPLPNIYTVTAGGTSYCAGSAGYHVDLSTSDVGFSYQLLNGGVPSGFPMSGTGALLDYGLQLAGTYSVVATNNSTGCSVGMSGAPTITSNPLPTAYAVTGGGHFCTGGSGKVIGVANSTTGINYQLYLGGLAIGAPVPGNTGSSISFGSQTAAGAYTVLATNPATTCSKNMTGSVTITIDPLPNVYTITGGGAYCTGGSGKDIALSGSDAGVNYQLWNGGTLVATLAGTGAGIDFGLISSAGTYTVIAINGTTTCTNNMAGSVTITISPLPSLFTVMGGGGYCTGGSGSDVSLSFSNSGINYQLYNGFSAVGGPVAGTGFPIDFGLQTAAGTYTVRATNVTTGCNNTMTGSATVTVNPLPVAQIVNGGGSYCAGGAGLPVGLNNSVSGRSYQLMLGGSPVGAPVAGTGSAITFGPQTPAGVYTVVGTNTTTLCSSNMSGSATININPLPNPYVVTGGGGYCAGGTGFDLTLTGSDAGVSYQLYNGGTPSGLAKPGTGSLLDFGVKTAPGTYTVHATNISTTCNVNMTGASTISINPLPIVYTVTGGGNYCASGVGVHVGLLFSSTGISYQLMLAGFNIGSPVVGTGSALDFGLQTGTGNYTVVATNIVTGCTSNMAGSVNVTSSTAPLVYTLSAIGGGAYCAGSGGAHVILGGSNTGVSYQLFNGGVPVGLAKVGTGSPIDFGAKTLPGTYTVVATNAITGCSSNMSGAPIVSINPLPTAYSVTGGGAYCTLGTGSDVALSNSDFGVSYELFRNGFTTGITLSGLGSLLDFSLQTLTGTYTIVATSSTGCVNNMIGTAVVSTLPLPTVFTVTGGGNYCAGSAAPHVMLSGSNTGISYQLLNGGPVGMAVAGTNFGLDFGAQSATGFYSVQATNTFTGCTVAMTASAPVNALALPNVDTVTGGGSYCAGATGLHVDLKGSQSGMNYQLYNGSTPVGGTLLGTGSALDFGVMTAAGTYTVSAKNPATTCISNQYSFATILINPTVVPMVNVTTPVGTVCEGTSTTFTANPVLGGSSPMYQWSVNGTPISGATDNIYTDVSVNLDDVSVMLTSNQACASPLTANGSFTIAVNPMTTPTVTITSDPVGAICPGTTVNFTANPHHAGTSPTYIWMKNTTMIGTGITASAMPANNDNISCQITSSDVCRTIDSTTSSVTMTVTAPVAPVVTLAVTPGKNIIAGQLDTVTATVVSGGGPNPTYEWLINSVPVPGQVTNMFISSNFNNHDSVTCIVTGSGPCGGLPTAKSTSLNVRITTAVNQVTSLISDIRVVPNPNKGSFIIKGNLGTTDDQQVSLEVTNMLGQVVYTNKVTATSGNLNEQVKLNNSLANGMYILNVRSGTENSAFHFVMEQ